MVREMLERADSPTGETTAELNSRSGVQDRDINNVKLRTFSRSLENLTSETLYSKWKRARGGGINKSASPRPRSISLVTPPNISREEVQQPTSKPTRKNSFHVLQENVFRPRYWTIAGPMEVIREHNAMHVLDANNNKDNSPPIRKTRKLGRQFRVALEIPQNQHSPPPPTSKMQKAEQLLGAEMKPVSKERKEQGDSKQTVEAASEIFVESAQKLRRGSEGGRGEDEDAPIIARLLSEDDTVFTMADSVPQIPVSNLFVETTRIEIPQQSASMPASPNFLMRKDCENAWDTVDGADEQSGGLKNTVVKGASEMTTNKERLKSLKNTFSLGCTYAVISQPSRAKENSVKQIAKMDSTVISKEQRAELEEEYKKLKKLSLEFDRAEFEEASSKPYSLSEAGTKEISESPQPFRRFSEVNNSTTRNISSNRSTAKDILENITNVANKTEKQRIQNIEKAFEWIRKELAELRAQDKDIMRTFSKIQAGIRKITLQHALSGDLDELYEYDIVDHSEDLSASFSYVPLVKEFHNTFPRRASLI